MHSNRIEGMRMVATNLRMEGQSSRADAVTELCGTVERTQRLLALARSSSLGMPAALRQEIDEALEGFRHEEQGNEALAEHRSALVNPKRDDVLYP